jgi:hypothetical protein
LAATNGFVAVSELSLVVLLFLFAHSSDQAIIESVIRFIDALRCLTYQIVERVILRLAILVSTPIVQYKCQLNGSQKLVQQSFTCFFISDSMGKETELVSDP